MALIDDLNTMAKLMRQHEDKFFYDTIYGGPNLLRRMPPVEPRLDRNPLWGMQVRENHMFPYEQSCGKCAGTGDGVESTFCPTCKGAGRYRVEGAMVGAGGKMAVIMHYYPGKPVKWPASVAVPRRPSPGIRAVAWP